MTGSFHRRPLTLALAACALLASQAQAGDPLFRWVQLVANAKQDGTPDVMIKAIMDAEDSCPSVYVNNKSVVTLAPTPRSKPAGFDKIQLCEARIVNGDPLVSQFATAALDDQGKHTLPLPDLRQGVPVNQLIAFGCTGCRQKKDEQTKCNDNDWPFADVLKDAVDKAGSASMPAVVAHLGDLRYAGQKKEADSWTYTMNNTLGWQEEFFKPAQDLLKSNWWIVMRGNHEACLTDPFKQTTNESWQDRGAAWLYFFDDQKNSCQNNLDNLGDVLPSYALNATVYTSDKQPTQTNSRLVVMDMVRTGDERDRDKVVSKNLYASQFDTIAGTYAKGDRPLWLLTHIPMVSLKGDIFEDTVVMDAVMASQMNAKLDQSPLTVAAHVHEFQLINAMAGNPTAKRPLQYIAGNGGVSLSGKKKNQDACMQPTVTWTPIGGTAEVSENWYGRHRGGFGYFRASFNQDGSAKLEPRFYDISGKDWSEHKGVNCQLQSKDGEAYSPELPKSDATPACKP
ncbi:MAG: hypothetical protein G8345_14630 [Magnetococcales bacterium]|nr:hypothetical protein [Magnetococcales bacterium]